MKVGIDISQLAYEKTGVAKYLRKLVETLLLIDSGNEYVLFFSSLRSELPKDFVSFLQTKENVTLRQFRIPPRLLDFLWNVLHIAPIEFFVGAVDIFITSDWTEPPANAKKATILYDLIVYTHPQETDRRIVSVQKRKLEWVKEESDIIFCISKATKKDAQEVLGIDEKRLRVLYPGIGI